MGRRKAPKKIVALGGGTGTHTVMSGLKRFDDEDEHFKLDLTAIVSMADDGGSSGVLRDEMGVLPPGDIWQALTALSNAEAEWREVLNYRFTEGGLNGHRMGNLFLAALEKCHGDPIEGIRAAHKLLNVRGKVIPITREPMHLKAELIDGSVLRGEHEIDNAGHSRSPIRECVLDTPVDANPEALEAIRAADIIVIGPGDLYTSVIPVLLVNGVTTALAESKGKIVYVVNLMTKRGQTDGFTSTKFRDVISRYCHPAPLHYVIQNGSVPSDQLLRRYAEEGEELVFDDLLRIPLQRICREKLISPEIMEPVPGDVLRRSLIRHDPRALARAILSFVRERS
jgi:uncharacterized cofD-like protein